MTKKRKERAAPAGQPGDELPELPPPELGQFLRTFVCTLDLKLQDLPPGLLPASGRPPAWHGPALEWRGSALHAGGETDVVAAEAGTLCPDPSAAFFASPERFASALAALLDAMAAAVALTAHPVLYFHSTPSSAAPTEFHFEYTRSLAPPARSVRFHGSRWRMKLAESDGQWKLIRQRGRIGSAWGEVLEDLKACLRGHLTLSATGKEEELLHILRYTLCARERGREARDGVLVTSRLRQTGRSAGNP